MSNAPTTAPLPELWTVIDVAKFLRVSRSTVYNRLHELPHFSVGAQIRFWPEAVIAWAHGEATDGRSAAQVHSISSARPSK